ncbi:MAG: phosphoribosylglycinamide formyltransferase [Phycisphaerae bacterium]|nr:phosphoribosylglycinamide formyltransferase [Phycisphaerae bacterium]
MTDKVVAYTDGGSRGNPGRAAAAVVMTDAQGRPLLSKGFFLGRTTNNVAEYTAVLKALQAALELGASSVEVVSDSELLVRQIQGRYAVRSDQLLPLYQEARRLLERFGSWTVRHVARDQNKRADALVNQTLDAGADVSPKTPSACNSRSLRLGVLISGGGRTLMNLLDRIRQGSLRAQIPLVISSRAQVAGVDRARAAGLNVVVLRRKDFQDTDSFSRRLAQELGQAGVELVAQAGWLCLWRIPQEYEGRVMNIHPALLPSFGGQGMWGHHVHEAVLRSGCKVSGCTVHFCTDEYDAGPIILQRTCPVQDDDTVESLAARVFEQECLAYPEAIRLFAEDRLVVRDGRVRVKPQPR